MTGSRHRNAKQRTVDRVYEDVRADIIRGQHPPGSRLTEEMLAERYEVSRTPVRAALHKLASDGFVDMIPRIGALIKREPVMLFMKGNKNFPQCGFSNTAVQILSSITPDFECVDVLADNEIREGIKAYSNWPTIPQLYVKGEFVGGCDIISEMTMSGELETLLDKSGVSYSKEAAQKIRGSNS